MMERKTYHQKPPPKFSTLRVNGTRGRTMKRDLAALAAASQRQSVNESRLICGIARPIQSPALKMINPDQE